MNLDQVYCVHLFTQQTLDTKSLVTATYNTLQIKLCMVVQAKLYAVIFTKDIEDRWPPKLFC